jgi:hypothetical protein
MNWSLFPLSLVHSKLGATFRKRAKNDAFARLNRPFPKWFCARVKKPALKSECTPSGIKNLRILLPDNIIDDIMNKKKIRKLRKRLETLRIRPGNIKARELIKLAQQLGRVPIARGKHPTYVSEPFPRSNPISIPNHPGAMKSVIAKNILDQLEQDVFAFEAKLEEEEELSEGD